VRIVGCYYAAMGTAEVADLKEPKHKVLQSLAAALMPAHGFTVCLVFSNANSGKALSVPPPLQSPAAAPPSRLPQLSECHLPFTAWTLQAGHTASHWKRDDLAPAFQPGTNPRSPSPPSAAAPRLLTLCRREASGEVAGLPGQRRQYVGRDGHGRTHGAGRHSVARHPVVVV
jgi:hypothetical protein